MASKNAKISSIEVLESFHLQLSVFSEETLSILDSINTEVKKRLHYLEFTVAAKWRRDHAKWKEKLREANKELSISKTPSSRIVAEQQKRQSKVKIRECEEKIQQISTWIQRLQLELPLPQSRLLKLKTFIANDIDKSRVLLKEYYSTLREYTEIKGKKEV